MFAINQNELAQIGQILQQVLQTDNEARKGAEASLNEAKRAQADSYACLMVAVLNPNANFPLEVKSLAAVILRRNVSISSADSGDLHDNANNANLWQRMSDSARAFVKAQILESLNSASTINKNLTHKVCSLAVEIQGAMQEHEDNQIWQELLNVLFSFISTEMDTKVDAALQVFNGLFSYIMDHLVNYKDDLKGILQKTLNHQSLDIKLAALQATVNFLTTAERKDTKAFVSLLPLMVQVIKSALDAEDETVLEDALVDFNELAEIEPSFFKQHFKEIYHHLKPVIAYQEFANDSIRQQPLEFVVTILERQPSIVKKDLELLKDVLESIFKLMIDIDIEIDASWLTPKEGFQQDGDEEEDHVAFGKNCVDRLVSSIGEEIMLPLIGTLVLNTIQNDTDWRYKHAGIMAFSQVGEYVDDPQKIAMMVPVLCQHCTHPNPKIRYASLHAIGQIADDMPEEFQKNYHTQVLPVIIQTLDDPVARVQSHACAALTNFMEGANQEIVLPYLQVISQKLCLLIQNGISLVKENAATALASTVEQAEGAFIPYFQETLSFLIGFLNQFYQPEYKQFRGQVIEAITIICAGVGEQAFMPVANDVIQVMLSIQTTQLEKKDAQRIYLLSAWQRICLLMKTNFAPYLKDVLPSIFSMALLNPEMGISGQDALADLSDVLNEIRPEEAADKKTNILTDEIEEKDVAIQMLSVFIDELGFAFADYVEPAAKVLLSLTTYTANDSIRQTCVSALPGLLKCAKQAGGVTQNLHNMARAFNANILEAMKVETETDVLISQTSAIREIILEMGINFLTQDEVNFLGERAITIIDKSLNRIKELEEIKQVEAQDEDDELDQEDLNLIKEQGNNEYDLQIAAAELIGSLFKTAPTMVSTIVNTLRQTTLNDAFASEVQKRKKFGLFILDDMVEHLGPNYFTPADYAVIVQTVCSFAQNKSASLRQAAAYGIGVIATHGGHAFAAQADNCLQALKGAVEYQMTSKIHEKKAKSTQFHHARDNAVASIGKVIKFQEAYIRQNQQMAQMLTSYWISVLPITHDIGEAQLQYQYLAEFILREPEFILGANPTETAQQVAKVFGEAFQEKYLTETNKLVIAECVRYMIERAPGPVQQAFQAACQNVLTQEHQQYVEQAYHFKG